MSASLVLGFLLTVECFAGTVESFKSGSENACFLNELDEFTCIGYNNYGQLGLPGRGTLREDSLGNDDDETGDNLPVIDFGNSLTVLEFDVGSYFACAIRSDNKVVCWGSLWGGQNGMSSSVSSSSDPSDTVLSETGTIIPVSITLGSANVFILDAEGNAYGWGKNSYGSLGYGTTEARSGEEVMGDNLEKIDLGVGRTVEKIAAGHSFTCALLDDSSVKCFGSNGYGTLGLNDTVNRGDLPYSMGDNLTAIDFGDGFIPKDIGVMNEAACALSTLGEIRCWGKSGFGELGHERSFSEIELYPSQSTNIGTGRTALKMATGDNHVCVLRDDESVVCWGINSFYNLGIGTDVDVGNNVGDMGDNLVPIDYGETDVVADLVCGYGITCLMFEDKRAKCYGRNEVGNLAYGNTLYSGAGENASTVDYMMFRSTPDDEPVSTECSVVISTEGDSSLTWDLTDSEGDEEIASGEFGGDSVTITASKSEGYLLFLSSTTVPSGSITIEIDGDATTYELDSNTSTESEIADITCAGITAASSDGSAQTSMSLLVFVGFLILSLI